MAIVARDDLGRSVRPENGVIEELELTDRQRAFASAYVINGGNRTEAAKSAGYAADSLRTVGYGLLQLPHVRALINAEQQKQLARLASVALITLEELMTNRDKVSPAVRLDAAKTVLDRAGHISKVQAPKDSDAPKALNDMTIDELDAFIAAGRIAVDKARDSGALPGECVVIPPDSPQDSPQGAEETPIEHSSE